MLVITWKDEDTVHIDGERIKITKLGRNRIGITAPRSVTVLRDKVLQAEKERTDSSKGLINESKKIEINLPK